MRILSVFISLLLATASYGQVRIASDQEVTNLEKQVRGWAATFYPALLQAKRLPDELILGFLVDKVGSVQKHSVGFKGPEGESVDEEIVRLFPGTSGSQLDATGGVCLPRKGHEPAYCVVYAYLR
jgi:hypothetical protein